MKYVLFVCTHNAGRSQMAQALFERVDDWDIPDPAGRPLAEVREIRDVIEASVRDLVENRIEEIESDPTSHQWRLAKLLPPLIQEFADSRTPEVIRGCADRILDDYDHVPIRSHIFSLAHKRTRDCLKHETCKVLEHAGA